MHTTFIIPKTIGRIITYPGYIVFFFPFGVLKERFVFTYMYLCVSIHRDIVVSRGRKRAPGS